MRSASAKRWSGPSLAAPGVGHIAMQTHDDRRHGTITLSRSF